LGIPPYIVVRSAGQNKIYDTLHQTALSSGK